MRVETAVIPRIWTIIEHFYASRRIYLQEHDTYEQKVAQHVARSGLPRDQIRLGPEELSKLLRFKELELVRDTHLTALKRASHALFRGKDKTDYLDRLINDIFHEISILKEEHYNVLTYDPEAVVSDRRELESVLDEVHTVFPQKVHRLKHLFELARARLERILPRYRSQRVLVRSLFLHRDGIVAESVPGGLLFLYGILYGEGNMGEGFRVAGDSFFRSGFYEQALEAFEAGERTLAGLSPAEKRRQDPSWKELRDHFARHQRLCRDRIAQRREV